MPSLRESNRRHAKHYLEFARNNRADFTRLTLESANTKNALEFYLKESDWQALAELVIALNDWWIQTGEWNEFLKYAYMIPFHSSNQVSDLPASHNRIIIEALSLPTSSEEQSITESSPQPPLITVDLVRLLGKLAEVEEFRGNNSEARRLYNKQIQLLDNLGSGDEGVIMSALTRASRLASHQGDGDESRRLLERGLQIAQKRGAKKEEAEVLLELASLYKREGELEKADSLCFAGLQISRDLHYVGVMIEILKLQGSIRRFQYSIEDAKSLYKLALDAASTAGDQYRAIELEKLLAEIESEMARRVFISYNHHDLPFVERLARDLKAAGLSIWWDKWEIKVGDSIVEKVREGIDASAHLAIVLSPHSVNAPWVKQELGSGLMRKLSLERDITILPLLIADCSVPSLLNQIKWADFRQNYDKGFHELISTLAPS